MWPSRLPGRHYLTLAKLFECCCCRKDPVKTTGCYLKLDPTPMLLVRSSPSRPPDWLYHVRVCCIIIRDDFSQKKVRLQLIWFFALWVFGLRRREKKVHRPLAGFAVCFRAVWFRGVLRVRSREVRTVESFQHKHHPAPSFCLLG